MDRKQLTYFKNVAELGSFSKAAVFLSIGQPALSRQIAQLEHELGVSLLYRNGRGVALTEAGALLLDRGNAILEQFRSVQRELTSARGTISGKVTLGVTPTVSQVLTRPLVSKLRALYPQMRMQIFEALSGHIHEWLADGRLDVAVLYDAPRTRSLMTDRLLVEELLLIGAAGGPVASLTEPVPGRKLAEISIILPSRPHGLRLLVDERASELDISLHVDLEIDALHAIKGLVEDGAGATVLPQVAVHEELANGRLVARHFAKSPFTRTLVLATSTQRALTPAASALVDQVKAEVNRLHADGLWSGSRL